MNTVTYSHARENLAKLWDEIEESREEVVLRRRGHEDLALIPARELRSLKETVHLLRSPRNAARLLTALARSGKGGRALLDLENAAADRLARELAAATGETLTEAVTRALQARLDRTTEQRRARSLRAEIERIQERVSRLEAFDPRSADEILGFDENGLPA